MKTDIHDDNYVAAVTIAKGAVRGRIIRLGDALDIALGCERYPTPVARLLGEAILISALVARSLKFKGKLLVQAHGTNEGAVSMLAAECTTEGDVRAYARFDPPSLERILDKNKVPDAETLMGGGTFAMTIDQGANTDRYQGLSEIKGKSLGDCAEYYFQHSEQIPTILHICVGEVHIPGKDPSWRGGGIMVQRIPQDEARKDEETEWGVSSALMSTLTDAELIDPDVPGPTLLYRMFAEQGVSMGEPKSIQAKCSCSRERLLSTIKTFEKSAQDDMFVDGKITANCEFCGEDYHFHKDDL